MAQSPSERRQNLLIGGGFALFLGAALVITNRPTVPAPPAREVRDVTQLVRIPVERVVSPTTIDQLQRIIRTYDGPISIGGGRFSMGGQIATDGTLFVDMRGLDTIFDYDPKAKTIRVGAGCTWRKIQEKIDPDGLSLKIMQSYANFTVGGSLSVNAHGRYAGQGPLVRSVRAIDLVMADGNLVHATRDDNVDVFWGAAGGYGYLGAIAAVELDLADNVAMERHVARMPVGDFTGWFGREMGPQSDALMFNADLYPPDYDDLVAITFHPTTSPLTVTERLQSQDHSTAVERFTYWWVSEAPLGKEARSEVIDRLRLESKPVVWRNWEASYDVRTLDPGSREKSTYVLQEYFVPVGRFDEFVPKMREVFQRNEANVVNVSVRHAVAEPHSFMSWAPDEVYAFVVYYKQGTDEAARAKVADWTRELIAAALSVGGRHYLPYQIVATDEQFHQGYPRARDLMIWKRIVDPTYKFRNRLWDRYDPPPVEQKVERERISAALAQRPGWRRPEDQTFWTLPEWMIVYSADELGDHLKEHPPSTFPFFASVAQFWRATQAVAGATSERYPTNTGYMTMVGVIGASYTVEYAIKGAWEATAGRLTEGWAGGAASPEDAEYARIARDYGAFIHHTPWYAYPFSDEREGIWQVPGSSWSLRGWERRGAYWAELAFKDAWGGAMGAASQGAYGPETDRIQAWVHADPAVVTAISGIQVVENLGGDNLLIELPRYEPFSTAVPALALQGVRFEEIAGGKTILVQVIADQAWAEAGLWGDVIYRWPILTRPGLDRVAIEVPVARLHEILPELRRDVKLEHVYDY